VMGGLSPGAVSPFEFALVSDGMLDRNAWLDLVARAEQLGYDSVLVSDHVDQRLAPFAALAAAAAASTRLHLGTFVLNNDLRHPVLVAREVATVHELSGGRAVLGIGAGWHAGDYAGTGTPREPGGVRAARLEEALGIITSVLDGEPVAVRGAHYRVDLPATGVPAGPRPQLLLGGSRPRVLRLAGRYADVVSIVPPLGPDGPESVEDLGPDGVAGRVAAAAWPGRAGQRLNHLVWECFVTPRPDPVLQALAGSLGCPPQHVREMPCFLVGTEQEVAETLEERRARWGFSYVTVPAAAAEAFAGVIARLRPGGGT
jgi:probable F420-dependent oxidoreductase